MPGTRASLAERFWPKVDRSAGLFGCWPFTGAVSVGRGGLPYGAIQEGGRGSRILRAHRVALVLKTGDDFPELESGHSTQCTTTLCCRPDHLRWVTRSENELDKAETAVQRAIRRVMQQGDGDAISSGESAGL